MLHLFISFCSLIRRVAIYSFSGSFLFEILVGLGMRQQACAGEQLALNIILTTPETDNFTLLIPISFG